MAMTAICETCNAETHEYQLAHSQQIYEKRMCGWCEVEYGRKYWTPEKRYAHMYEQLKEQGYNVSMYRIPKAIDNDDCFL